MPATGESWGRSAPSRASALLALLLTAALTLALGVISTGGANAAAGVELTGLEVEKKAEPVGIDVDQPRFSWIITSTERGVMQESYRLRLATSPAALDDGTDLVWDSGTVASSESSNVKYTGPDLAAATDYFWRVDVVTNAGAATASSQLRTGLHTEADWAGAAWIGNSRPTGDDELDLTFAGASWIWTADASTDGAPAEPRAFRTELVTPSGKEAASADILITADDSFRLWVNGELLGETEGAVNEWQQSHLFTVPLEAGRNVVAVRTTNGPASPAGLVAAVRVSYTDGSTEVFPTGTSWRVSDTVPDGFEDPAFDDSSWDDASVVAAFGSGPWGSNVRPPADDVNAAPLLRREFTVDGDVRAATLYLAAGGYADVTLNGNRISEDMLSPGFTDYDDTVQYAATDLTDQLRAGQNALGMELGRGFYGMTGANVWWWERAPWHDEPVVRAVLQVEYADGRVEHVVTDDSWTIDDGPTVFDDLYAGETYDASRVQPGFDTAGFDDSSWARASEVDGPAGVLVNQRQQPVRVTEELPAVEITEPVADTYVVKFPRVLAGNVEVTAEGEAGDTIRFQYGEKLRDTGLVNFDNNGGFQSGFQTDRFILAGTGGPETWEARFSYKGFQYIQVTGWPGDEPPTAEAFTAKLLHTDAAETGVFESSEDIMNRVHRAVVDTLKNNIHHIPTDTPMFEKNGWTGDAAVGGEMFLMNLDTHELFAKWLRDVHETRDAEGAPLVIAPSSGSWGEWGVAPTWHSAYVTIPRWLYQYGNDARVMTELYDGMAAYVDLEYDRSPGGIATTRLADWMNPESNPAGGNAPEDVRVSATAYLYLMLTEMAATATFLGEDDDAARFTERAAVVKEAFNAEFLDDEEGYYRGNGDRGYRQTHNVLALAFGLAPDAETAEGVAASIVADIDAKGGKLNTGVLGTKYLLPVLTDHGYADIAFDLAVETGYPSWGFMLESGSGSMWEHWAPESRSLGHYFLGTVDDWFYHDVGGINASPTEGYRDITIRPAVTTEMDWARATVQSPFGPVTSHWQHNDDGQLRLDVDIPVGTTASVHVPAESTWAVTEGGLPLDRVDGVTAVTGQDGEVVVEIGSGSYSFAVDALLGDIGEAGADVAELRSVIEDLDLPRGTRAPLTSHVDRLARHVDGAWEGQLVGSHRVPAEVHLGLNTAGAIQDWVEQHRDTRLDDESADRIAAAAADVIGHLSDASASLVGATVRVAVPTEEIYPGERVAVDVVAENAGGSRLTHLDVSLAGPAGWVLDPVGTPPRMVPATGEASTRYELVVPDDAEPGAVELTGEVRYQYRSGVAVLPITAGLTVGAAVTIDEAVAAPVGPGGTTEVTVVLRNRGPLAETRTVALTAPEGWTAGADREVTVPAQQDLEVALPLTAPVAVTEGAVPVVASVGTHEFEQHAIDVAVKFSNPPASFLDHIDLGEAASEEAHDLTASPASGTSVEAGLTRRYTNQTVPGGWFEFDLEVPADEPFVLRAIETYDGAHRKEYAVSVDGDVVLERAHDRSDTGAGTVSYQFVVDPSPATADGVVRVRFQHTGTGYDPSIADVWVLPATAGPEDPAD
ncbi:family 78 glycoside hydrolase catalytic domain [Georgenia sp. MJ173]|uniref:family 78 glycoside hydrolase catalytic domain n=1 Tax=Georgenia sunbinii TaxID=3117728 RepID=UPI002F262117